MPFIGEPPSPGPAPARIARDPSAGQRTVRRRRAGPGFKSQVSEARARAAGREYDSDNFGNLTPIWLTLRLRVNFSVIALHVILQP